MSKQAEVFKALVDDIINPPKRTPSHYASALVGKTIKNVRALSDAEIDGLYWGRTTDPTTVIEFTDGTYAIVMCDPEGNGTGFLEIGTY